MVTSVNPLGIFADVGPIQAFISSNVRIWLSPLSRANAL